MNPIINIENLGFDSGAAVLLKNALSHLAAGESILVKGRAPAWDAQLFSWCRSQGHEAQMEKIEGETFAKVTPGNHIAERWRNSQDIQGVQEKAEAHWGLSARGARVEQGSPEFEFRLNKKNEVWSENLAELYSQAVAAQWKADEAIDWKVTQTHSDDLEDAVVQIMTYLIENENAALVVPARFLGQVHPHFREVQALLAIQVADESRHIDVFTRRLRLFGRQPALSTAGGQASLKTLVDESDFSVASFLLSVLGEGSFVDLLQFLNRHAPDPVTKQITLFAARDESRHVAFGMRHLIYHLEREPALRFKLSRAVQTRHEGLADTSGLNQEVFDSLVVLAAGDFSPHSIAAGFEKVQGLVREMHEGRRTRLLRLGFPRPEAEELSALHTRNFM